MPRKRKQAETIEELLAGVRKKYGQRALAVAGEVEELYTVEYLPTGIEAVDSILGGGLPRGHLTELFGPFSSGKSYLTLKAIARTQADGGIAALIDTEVSFSPKFAKSLGVDLDQLLISTPEYGEEALDIAISLVKRDVDLVVLDSATSLASKDELSKQVEVGSFAHSVRLWNAGLIRLKPLLFGKKTAFAFSNQVRDNIGVMYGPKTTEPMGWRSKHDAVLRLEIKRKEWIKKGDQRVGQVTLVRIAKTKVDGSIPFAETTFDITWGDNDQGRVSKPLVGQGDV